MNIEQAIEVIKDQADLYASFAAGGHNTSYYYAKLEACEQILQRILPTEEFKGFFKALTEKHFKGDDQ